MTATDSPTETFTSTPTYCNYTPYSPGGELSTVYDDHFPGGQVRAYAVTLTSSAQLSEIGVYYRTSFVVAAGPATVKAAVYSVNGGTATLVPGSAGEIDFSAGADTPYSWYSFPVSASLPAGEYLLVFEQLGGNDGFELGGCIAVAAGDIYTATTSSDITVDFSPWTLPTATPGVYGNSYLKYCP
jgi:hypothetical protein